jgi:hypothetical protein
MAKTALGGLLSFCSRDPRAILIPDYQFVTSRGYEDYRELANAGRMKWSECGDRIVWRGSTTGIGKISTDNLSADDPDLLLRVRLCLRLKGIPGCDAKISGIAQSSNPAQDEQRLARAGIVGEYIWPLAWHTFKFAIDVDGNSNAWTTQRRGYFKHAATHNQSRGAPIITAIHPGSIT